MHRAPTGRIRRAGGGAFVPIPQLDATNPDDEARDNGLAPQRWTADRFRSSVQHVLRQGSGPGSEQDSGSVRSSPALSDITLIGGDYLDHPVHGYAQVPLHDDARGDLSGYIEYYGGNYGPQAADLSPTLKAGLGIEVNELPHDALLSPSGLYVDDPSWANIAYRGSEGNLEEEKPYDLPPQFTPFVLRARFLVPLFFLLLVMLALTEIAIRLLPDGSEGAEPFLISQNMSEIRIRSLLSTPVAHLSLDGVLPRRQNDTGTSNPGPQDGSSTTNPTSTTLAGISTTSTTSTSVKQTTSRSVPVDFTSITSTTLETPSTTLPEQITTSTLPTEVRTSTPLGPSTPVQVPSSTPPEDSPGPTQVPPPNDNTSPIYTTPTSSPSAPDPDHSPDPTTNHEPDPPIPTSTTSTSGDHPGVPWNPEPTSTPTSAETVPSVTTESSTPTETTTDHHPPWWTPPGETTTTTTGDSSSLTKPWDPPGVTSTISQGASSSWTNPWDPPGDTTAAPGGDPPFTNPWNPPGHSSSSSSSSFPSSSSSSAPTGPSSGGPSWPDFPWPSSWPPPGSQGPFPWPPESSTSMPAPSTTPSTTLPAESPTRPPPPPEPTSTTETSVTITDNPSVPDNTTQVETPTSTLLQTTVETTLTTPKQTPTIVTSPPSVETPSSIPPESMIEITNSTVPQETLNTVTNTPPVESILPDLSSQLVLTTSSSVVVVIPAVPTRTSHVPPQPTPEEVEEPFTTIIITSSMPPDPPPATTTFVTSASDVDGVFIETTVTLVHNAKVVTDYTETLRDSNGVATATTMFQAGATLTTETYVDQFGRPTKTETKQMLRYPKKTTLADIQGVATATLDYYLVDSLVTLYDKDGRPTATQTTSVAETPSTMTFYDEHGVATKTETILLPMSLTTYTVTVTPTSTPPSPKAKAKAAVKIDAISDARYFLGLMLPTLVAIIISIPIRVLDQTAKLYHPFHALTAHRGASAADSLALPTTGLGGFAAGFTVLTKHHVVLPLTGLLVLLSAVLTPLTSEVLRVVVLEDGTECVSAAGEGNSNGTSSSTGHGCVMSLGVFPTTARAALGVLAAMALACGVAAVALWRWRTGLYAEPWSLAAMAPLASNPEMGALLRRLGRRRGRPGVVGHAAARRALRGGSFVLDFWKDNGMTRYGVLIHNEEDEGHHNNHNPHQQEAAAAAPLKKGVKFERSGARRIKNHLPAGTAMPFFALTWTGRVLFLLLLSGVVISVLTYDIIAKGTEYERGLTGNAVGVRFVFTAVGVLVTLLWGSFFYAVSFMSPYRTLYSDRPYKGEGINLVPPTNAFAGLRFAVSPLSRDAYLGVVSAVGILAEVLPLLLGNVPCNGVGNSLAEAVCTWMSVALLCVMMFVVAGSFFVNWPPMLIDPSTVAGSMYYACEHVLSRGLPRGPSPALLGRTRTGFA